MVRNINVDEMERLCLLLNCTPNDIFEWCPGKNIKDPSTCPLSVLIREEKVGVINELFKELPLEKLIEIENLIKKELGK